MHRRRLQAVVAERFAHGPAVPVGPPVALRAPPGARQLLQWPPVRPTHQPGELPVPARRLRVRLWLQGGPLTLATLGASSSVTWISSLRVSFSVGGGRFRRAVRARSGLDAGPVRRAQHLSGRRVLQPHQGLPIGRWRHLPGSFYHRGFVLFFSSFSIPRFFYGVQAASMSALFFFSCLT